jgi:hypothetical protein
MKIDKNKSEYTFPYTEIENFNSFSVTSRQAILCYVTHDCNQFKASNSYAAENFSITGVIQ